MRPHIPWGRSTAILDTLHARAQFSGNVRQVYRRIARVGQEIYLDMCDDDRRVIHITPERWSSLALDQASVRFERLKGAQALPSPVQGGDLQALQKVLNVSGEEYELVKIFLLGVLRGCKPFPILEVSGPDGAAKSWGSRLIARVLDPSSGSERGVIENARDFRSACRNSFVIVLDNLSHMEDWLSDAICRAAVGGPQAARTLFTDDDEGRLVGAWPFIINGIPALARRGDGVHPRPSGSPNFGSSCKSDVPSRPTCSGRRTPSEISTRILIAHPSRWTRSR